MAAAAIPIAASVAGGLASGALSGGGGGGGGGVGSIPQLNIGFDRSLTTPGFDFRDGTLTAGFTPQPNNPFRNALTGFLLGPNAGSITLPGTTTTVPTAPGSTPFGSTTTTTPNTAFNPQNIKIGATVDVPVINTNSRDPRLPPLPSQLEWKEINGKWTVVVNGDIAESGGNDEVRKIEELFGTVDGNVPGLFQPGGAGSTTTTTTPGEAIGLDELANNTFGGTLLDLRKQVTDTLSQLDPLRSGIQEGRGDIQALRDRVAPGFGELTDAAVKSVLDAGAQSIGNLRDSLSQRQVLGSSFANDAFTRTRLATGRAEEQVRAQAKIAEIGLTADLIQQELATFSQEFGLTEFQNRVLQQDVQNAIQQANLINNELNRQLEEFRIAGGVATATAQAATSAAIANAQLDAARESSNAQGAGALTSNILGGLGNIFRPGSPPIGSSILTGPFNSFGGSIAPSSFGTFSGGPFGGQNF